MHVVHRTIGGGGGGDGPEHTGGGAEAALLTFEWRGLLDHRVVQVRVGLVLRPQRGGATNQKERQHAGNDRPTLAQVLDVVAEGEHQRHGDQDDRRQFEQVAPGGGVLERVRRVDTEETATVGAQLLDRNLARSRPQRDDLVGTLQGHRMGILCEGLRHALPHQEQGQQQAQGQQAVEGGAGHVHPEIAQGAGRTPRNSSAQGNQHGKAGGSADEVLHGQASHLTQIADRRLTAVRLPVGIGDETHGGVERLRPLHARQLRRVKRQMALQQQHAEHQHETCEVECQQGQGVFLPALLLLHIDPGQAVAALLHRAKHGREPGALAFHYLVVEPPQPRRGQQHQREKGQDHGIVMTVHGAPLSAVGAQQRDQ
ncbi:hypothetical protein D9M71_183330 [compost metagenome]